MRNYGTIALSITAERFRPEFESRPGRSSRSSCAYGFEIKMTFSISASLLAFLQSQGYLLVFLLMMAEGPVVTYVAAFAASLGFFKIYYIWAMSLLATTLMDIMWFSIGKYGGETAVFKYFMNRFGESRINKFETFLIDHPGKTILVAKLTPGLSPPGLMLAGAIKVPFRKFLFFSSIFVATASSAFVWLGYYSGVAFSTVSKYFKYGEILIGATVITIVAVWILSRKLTKKISSRIEKI